MTSLVELWDGTDRPIRECQKQALEWYEKTVGKNAVLIASPGSGKSAIARTIQRKYGAAYLTPKNLLIQQMRDTYPDVNYLIGKDHYICCTDPSISCVDRYEIMHKRCKECHYTQCLTRAVEGEDTFYNPLSFYYMRKRENWRFPSTIIIDESHSILESLKNLVSEKMLKSRYQWPDFDSEVEIIRWMDMFLKDKKNKIYHSKNGEISQRLIQMYEKVDRIRLALEHYLHEFKIYVEENPEKPSDPFLVIEPIKMPTAFIKSFFGPSRVLLMSATMPDHLIKEVFGDEPYEKLELDSPIPAVNRPVVYAPPPFQIGKHVAIKAVAAWLRKVLDQFKGENTMVHVSYSMADKLKPYFPEALYNTPKNKEAQLRKFKKEGGLWIASGCAEGIDLPGDQCRVNIIPCLLRANLGDLSVLKSRALIGGQSDYEIRALIQLQQQVGRSTRDPDDRSIIIIGDKRFKGSFFKYKDQLSRAFREALVWDVDYVNMNKIKRRQSEAIRQR